MADIFNFYVYDDRSIRYELAEPIMLEDKDVTQFRFRIPKVLNNIDMSSWEWWLIFVNAKKVKYTSQLVLTDDEDDPENFSVATYTVGYGFSGYVGQVSFSIEALNVSGDSIVNEWHTKTYTTHVIDTLQGTRAVVPEPEGQTIESLINDLDARVTALENGGSDAGISQAEKNLILTLFSKAAYAEDDASTAYDALEALWASTTKTITYSLSHVSSSNTATSAEGGSRYTTTLTAASNYTLNTVKVLMGGVDITSTAYSSGTVSIPSVTGNIVITATAVLAAQSITAVYTQSGTVYDTDSLDSLKADLVVTANYSGGTTATVPSTDYTLSGTLAVGTSTITVSYAGLTDTFSVTVSEWTTAPVIRQSNAYYSQTGEIVSKNDVSITILYSFTIDPTAIRASGYYDSENDYMTQNGSIIKIKYSTTNTNNMSGSAYHKIVYFDSSDNFLGFNTITNSGAETTTQDSRQKTAWLTNNDGVYKVGFSLIDADIDNSYAYIIEPTHPSTTTAFMPDGWSAGDIIFAGSNTPYYGMHNISEASS